jgi:hypothetical protein
MFELRDFMSRYSRIISCAVSEYGTQGKAASNKRLKEEIDVLNETIKHQNDVISKLKSKRYALEGCGFNVDKAKDALAFLEI